MQIKNTLHQKKIIIIEDDKDINELISHNLRREGFCVWSAFDGIEAESMIAKEQFQIAVLDLMLPGIDGFEICKKIKEDKKSFKTFIVIVSAKAGLGDKLNALLLGADYYITKPFSVKKLVSIVKELEEISTTEFHIKRSYLNFT